MAFAVCTSPSWAREFPLRTFPAASPSEEEFRDALQLEGADNPAAIERYRKLLGRDFPLPDAVHWRLARLLPPAEAEPHWRAVLAAPDSPFRPEALEALADIAEKGSRLEEAQQWLEQLLSSAADGGRRARTLARLFSLAEVRGDADSATATARNLWVDYASSAESKRAETYLQRIGKDPFSLWPPEDALTRATNLLGKGSREEAVRTLVELRRRLPQGSPLAPSAAAALGKALYFLRRYEEALGPLAEAKADPRFAEDSRFYAARCLFGLNRGDEGAKDLVALAKDFPKSSKAPTYLYQGARVFEGRGMEEEARGAMELLRAGYPGADEVRETYWIEGWEAYVAGRFPEAVGRFSAAAEGAGRDWPRARCLYWKGRALLETGAAEEGRAVLEGVIAEFPLGYYAGLARARLSGRVWVQVEDPRKGETRLLPVLLPQPGDLGGNGAALGRAEAYLRLGLTEAGARVLRTVNGADPRKARLLYWAEDFRGALASVRRSWLDWPGPGLGDPAPLSPEGLAYPFGYPRTTAEAAREAGVHPHLVLAIAHTESHFDPRAYSWAEARGLMQFIPSTGSQVAKAAGLRSFTMDDLYDPGVALRLGARHLRELLDHFDGNAVLAVAAYNGGAAAVDRWRKELGPVDPTVFVESIPYRETRRYVKKVLTALDAYGRMDPPGLWPARSPAEQPP